MSVKKAITRAICLAITTCLYPAIGFSLIQLKTNTPTDETPAISKHYTLAEQLGWVSSPINNCGGYYIEEPFIYPVKVNKNNTVEIIGKQGSLSLHGTSILEGKVSFTREGQQVTANKAFFYRDPNTGKLNALDLVGDVHIREPNTLVVGKTGYYNFDTRSKSLKKILYRTTLVSGRQIAGPKVAKDKMEHERKITSLTAWGKAYEFSQTKPKIFEFTKASFSTCPPTSPAWRLKASHIVLNKEEGEGYATHARILVKNIPVLYVPYIDFPLDNRRKSGFLWPTMSPTSNQFGPYLLLPFYWNMAPNYDMTITPGLLSKRGVQLSDSFRYLTHHSRGTIYASVLPGDRDFSQFKRASAERYSPNPSPVILSELTRLENSSTTRKGAYWLDHSTYNDHWSSAIDFSYAGDDYYVQNFSSNLNEATQNQLLQAGSVYYKSQNWDFTGRLQGYQTLHPISESTAPVQNQYRRYPQLVLNGAYPDQALGLEYFAYNEAVHFTILNMPGTDTNAPIGNRLNTQPGISLPLTWPYFYINPRAQVALTQYNLYQTTDTQTPNSIKRAVPIFDVASGFSFDRDTVLFRHAFQQTLEPQVYYTYIPYRNQSAIPVFDTTVNTLTYDQLFNYNRFSGIDRIGDANQVGLGVTTRLIDQDSGLEKVRIGVGEIVYFANRLVTLCNDTSCTDNPTNHSNYQRLSPISGLLNYHINSSWNMGAVGIWNPISKQLDNSTLGFHYQPDGTRLLNLGYSFARNGDIQAGPVVNTSQNNLKISDLSLSWPIPMMEDISGVGRWSQAWNTNHLQNLIVGIQYDTCCWAVRVVGARVFTGLNPDNKNTLKFNNQFFIQFSLKGLGDIGSGNPSSLLSSINGYNTQFGQGF